jgi:hypothetical protein
MGNNAAFTSFEASVIAVYNKGGLDKELLEALAAPYEGTDIDRGGMEGTLAKDGFDIDAIVLSIYGVELPPRPFAGIDYADQTEEQRAACEEWYERQYDEISAIYKQWGWR